MIADVQCVVLDCPRPAELAEFYQAIVGGAVNQSDRRWALSDDWVTLHATSGLVLAFQRAADYQAPEWPDPTRPQQFHLDFGVADLDGAEEQVLALGATVLDNGANGQGWRVYADPAGHPFCLVRH